MGTWSGVCVNDAPKVCTSGLKCKQYYSAGTWSGVCVNDTPKTHTSGVNGVCGKHIGGPDGPDYVCDQGLECRQYYSPGTWAGVCRSRPLGQAPGNSVAGQ